MSNINGYRQAVFGKEEGFNKIVSILEPMSSSEEIHFVLTKTQLRMQLTLRPPKSEIKEIHRAIYAN